MRINISLLFSIIFSLSSCDVAPVLKGELTNTTFEKIYLSEIINEHYSQYKVIDSAEVVDGKFEFNLKDKPSQLYFVGNKEIGGEVFTQAANMQIDGTSTEDGRVDWNVKGSLLHDLYINYIGEKNLINCQKQRDSLSRLFSKAREGNNIEEWNRGEMARLKAEMGKYYSDEIRTEAYAFLTKSVDKNKGNTFGAYLYSTGILPRLDPQTFDEIEELRRYLDQFGENVKNTKYMQFVDEKLSRYSKCVIGVVAPEITGKDTIGNAIKLSDYRGKYVIVDFWSSGCKYCRWETPNLKKALEKYQNKNLTILGVSSDWKKDMWMKAIHEDESYWDHLKIDKEDISGIFDSYCINGIPHIILVDPQGKILAKDLRGKDIYGVPGKLIN